MTHSNNSNQEPHDDSAQRDAERTKRHYPLSFLMKLLAILLFLLLLVFIAFYIMAGTERGTRFIIEKIVSETGVELEYGEGNLRDGLLVTDITLSASEDLDVHFKNTFVKIGWRAMFMSEVHLRDAKIDLIEIENRKPATGEPFAYNTLELPVNLRFDKAHIDRIVYNQVGKDPVVVTSIQADDLTWVGTKVSVDEAALKYADVVNIDELSGFINLEGNYPLDVDAIATVNSLSKVYVDPLQLEATGSLKRTYGKLESHYNGSDVSGSFTVQGMDDNAPFDAKLTWDEVTLPYAEDSLDITLQNGLATASGVISDIELRINSELLANNIPSGHYQGRADIIEGQMLVQRLTAETPEGNLLAKGVLDWRESFNLKAMLYSRDYELRHLVPEVAAPYAPKQLDGKLAVVYDLENADGLMQINGDLRQRDGEHLHAKIIKGAKPSNPRFSSPWYVDASWQNLQRTDVPQIGNIRSPSGVADVQLRDNRLWVNADAEITELNVAPAGDYKLRLNKVNNRLNISTLDYNGEMGDLLAQGQVTLANKNNPLEWSLDAQTNELRPQVFSEDLPVTRLVGDIDASGTMIDISRNINGKTVKGQRHVFTLNATDLTATLTSEVPTDDANARPENRWVHIVGKGDGTADMLDGSLRHFDARFNGQIDSQNIPQGKLNIDVNGTPKNINVKTLRHTGDAGNLLASGNINLTDGVGWDIKADAKDFNVGLFASQTEAIVTGKLTSSGKWRSNNTKMGDLQKFAVKFNGSVDTPKLPKGRLTVNASGDSQAIILRQFSHVGAAGSLNAKGNIDVRNGIAWDINAVMNNFNTGYFLEDMPSNITGRVNSSGVWKDYVQQININKMNVRGHIQNKPIVAKGTLNTTLHLPKNMNAYLNTLKAADSSGQVKQVKSIIETLNANNLLMRWGDNQIVANGNTERLQAKVNLKDLSQVYSKLSGTVSGGITVVQPKQQALPTLYVDLKANNLALPNMLLSKGIVKGKIVDLGKNASSLVLIVDGLQASNNNFEDIKAVFNGTEQSHTLTLKANTNQADTDVNIKAVFKGGLDRNSQSWKGVIGNGEIATDYVSLTQNQPAQMIANFGGTSPSLRLAAHCWSATDQSGKLCFRDNLIASSDMGNVNITIQELDTSLFAAFLPKDLSWQAKLNGKARMGWKKGTKPSINATFYSDNGKVGMVQDEYSEPTTLPYKRVSVIVQSFEQGLKVRTDINSGSGARGYADIVVDPFSQNKPISGALVLNEFNLAILKPFFPGMRRLDGQVTMAGGLGGTLNKPVFYGDVNLRDASIAILDLPVNLTNINAKAKIRGQDATVNGTFMSGKGKGDITGSINWQQELQAKLRITGEHLVLTQPPLLYAEINPDFSVIVKPNQQYVNIVGAVSVPNATIRPPEANQEVVTKSEDVVVLDRRLIGNIDEVLAISKPWSINADIGLDLGNNVNFRGFGAVLPLAGAVELTQKGQGTMNALGVIQVSRRSDIDAFGQSLDLNYAQIRFNGDVRDPTLSIETVKKIENNTVGIRVKGNVSDPNITVFNDAGLTQQQAMNALVTGRISNSNATQISEEGFKSEVTNNLAAAGLSLGLSGTRNLTNSIGQAFGLERLTIDASGADNDANVNVTGYITPDLYIRYGVGVFNAQNSLSVRYQLTRRIYIEATSSIENAVDMVYSFEF